MQVRRVKWDVWSMFTIDQKLLYKVISICNNSFAVGCSDMKDISYQGGKNELHKQDKQKSNRA